MCGDREPSPGVPCGHTEFGLPSWAFDIMGVRTLRNELEPVVDIGLDVPDDLFQFAVGAQGLFDFLH